MKLRVQISRLLNGFVRRLFRLLPIKRRLIIFESSGDFSDNGRVFYEYLQAKRKYNFVWFVENTSRFQDTDDTIFLSSDSRFGRVKMLYYFAVAKFAFNTHGSIYNYQPRRGQHFVSLWHGTPLKASKTSVRGDAFDLMIAIGPLACGFQAKFSHFQERDVLPLGYPRNDLLLRNLGEGRDNLFCDPRRHLKVIIWMPTFRASNLVGLSETALDTATGLPLLVDRDHVIAFNDFLANMKVLCVVKIHRLQMDKPIFSERFSNIKFITDVDLDARQLQLYQMVGKSDALITDYSSILFDYLLADKPEGFIVDDMDGYKASRGFVVENIEEYLPGDHIYNIGRLEQFVCDVVAGKDNFQEDRRRLRDKMHVAIGGDACDRISQYFNL